MENTDFQAACGELEALRFPRWKDLPEFDLYMDQVIALAEKVLRPLNPDGKAALTPSMINNYVKSGALAPPTNKKYNRTHLALLLILCCMKSVLEISCIADLIGQSIRESSIEAVYDRFAAGYEAAVIGAMRQASEAAASGQSFSDIALGQAMNAGAARTAAAYAYSMTASKEEAPAQKSKAEKKAEKAEKKAKKEAPAEQE